MWCEPGGADGQPSGDEGPVGERRSPYLVGWLGLSRTVNVSRETLTPEGPDLTLRQDDPTGPQEAMTNQRQGRT
jgi:hypothetical protein